MILTDEEVEQRLTNPENLINKIKVVEKSSGQGKTAGSVNIPSEVRKLLGSLAIQSEASGKEIGSVFGVSQPVVTNAARGLVDDRLDADLVDSNAAAKTGLKEKTDLVHEAALDSLMDSLSRVSPLIKTEVGMDVKSLTRTAKDMSTVIANLQRGKKDEGMSSNTTNNTLVVLHAPDRRKEAIYETLDV